MKIVYLAHPYGGKAENLERARRWLRWAWTTYGGDIGFLACWVDACEALEESAENRARGLEFDAQVIGMCDEMWLVGGSISPGMEAAASSASRLNVEVVDKTPLGPEPPE